MAEYIEREAALEECDWYANEFCECEYAIMPLKGALEIIPAADVREVKWIPVTERLPEVRTWVLCYCRANSFDVFRMTDEGDWQYGNRSIYMKGYVTHWMPLPQPPKEESYGV